MAEMDAVSPSASSLELNKDGFSLIHRAVVQKNNLRIEKLLSISPLSLEAKTTDKSRLTPLLVAAKYGCKDTFHFLLKMGAKTGVTSSRGFNVVQCALIHNQHRVVGSLLSLPQFNVFKDVFRTITMDTLTLAELANCLRVLNGVISGHVVNTSTEEAARLHYTEEFKSENGLNILIDIMKTFQAKGGEMERELGPIMAAIIENMCFSRPILVDIFDSPLPEMMVQLIETMNSREGLTSLIHASASIISSDIDGAVQRITSIHAGRAALGAIQRMQDPSLMLTCLTCMMQLSSKPDVAENFHQDGILQQLVALLGQEDEKKGEKHKVEKEEQEGTGRYGGDKEGGEGEDSHKIMIEIKSIAIQLLTKVASISERFRKIILETKVLETLLEKLTKKSKLIIVIIDLLRVMCVQKGDSEDIIKNSTPAISTLVHVIKYSFSTYYQHKAFQILWVITQDDVTERRSLATLVGPGGLLNMLNITSESHLYTVTIALNLISPPIYEKQVEIVEKGGIAQMLYTVQVTKPPTQMQLLSTIENCSHDVSFRPLVEMQDAFLHENGIQVLLKLSAQSHDQDVSIQAICSLAAASIGSSSIKKMVLKDPSFSLRCLIGSVYKYNPATNLQHLIQAVRSLSYMAYNCLWVQKAIVETRPLPHSVFCTLMSSKDPRISTEAAFHTIILTPTFNKKKEGAEIVASGIRHLVLTLKTALMEGDDELQVHICMYLGALLRMRAGICQAFIAADLISLLVQAIYSPFENCRKTAAIALNYITKDQEGCRVILKECRTHKKLYSRIVKYSYAYPLDEKFKERWQHYCNTIQIPQLKPRERSLSICAIALAYKGARYFRRSRVESQGGSLSIPLLSDLKRRYEESTIILPVSTGPDDHLLLQPPPISPRLHHHLRSISHSPSLPATPLSTKSRTRTADTGDAISQEKEGKSTFLKLPTLNT